ncbi:TniQ family protein [Rhizobium sp. Rhizsp42]|uniref:TniQ family protein n=1 Tax=Rhizobium sp. Rhizsp42 TaxID=3243034 RepID=UPI0039B0450F
MTSPIKLPRAVPFRDDECVETFACRLAWANGFRAACDMLSSGQSNGDSLRTLSPKAVTRLAALSGQTEQSIRKYAVGPGVIVSYGESTVKRSQLNTRKVRFCPHCLREDHEKTDLVPGGHAYIRAAWGWSMITTCAVHGTPLISRAIELQRLQDFTQLSRGFSLSEAASVNEADVYFTKRLNKPAADSFLDEFPAYVSAEFCSLIGEFQETLHRGNVSHRIAGGFETPERRYAGYAIAKDGEEAVWSFLTDYVRTVSRTVTRPRSIYSAAHHWWKVNKHNRDYHPLMKLLQQHAEEHVALDRGETFFWPVLTRKVHTVPSAAVAYGLSEKRVKQILADAFEGDLPRFLKKSMIHRPLLDARSWLNTGEVAEILGCSIAIVDQIIKAGILTAIANTPEESRIYRLVHRSEVEELVLKIKSAVQVEEPTGEIRPLVTLRHYGGVLGALRSLLDGHIQRVYNNGPTVRFDAVQIDLDDLRKASRATLDDETNEANVDAELIDLTAARRRLKVTKSVVDAVIEAGLIPYIMRENRVGGKGRRAWVKTQDVDRFDAEFVTLDMLAVERNMTPMELLLELGGQGTRPVIQGGRFVGRYYRRSELS